MKLRFLSGLAIFVLALFLQFLFAFTGFHLTLILAVLIGFAFCFDFWELAFFDLLAVFILNWQPAASVTIITFAAVPFLVYAFRKLIHWEIWIGVPAAIFTGFFIFYLASAPGIFLANIPQFLEDVIAGLIVGELVFFVVA